jgi:hypothetical protein
MQSTTSRFVSYCEPAAAKERAQRGGRLRSDRVVWAILSALSILGVHPAAATNTLTTNATASVQSNGITYDFQSDTTPPTGSASATAAGTNFDGTAQAFVDASNYGDLRIRGSESMTGFGQSTADSSIRIVDTWTISNPLLIGQVGVMSASVFIDGDWEVNTYGRTTWDVFVGDRVAGVTTQYLQQTFDLSGRPNQPPTLVCQHNFVTTAQCDGLFTFAIPFVFGTPFDLDYRFHGRAVSSPANLAGIPPYGFAWYDLSNSLLWGGISSVTVGGNTVNYDFQSASGFDWRESSIPTNGAPEPTSLALVGLGLAALAWKRQSDRCRVTIGEHLNPRV